MRRSLSVLAAVAAGALLPASAAVAGEPAAARALTATSDVARVPVTFTVKNVNRSKLPCQTDGSTRRIRGELIGPRASLSAGRVQAVTMYLHGLEFGRFLWSFRAVPGYDYAAQQAAKGQVSLVLDRLGYDGSDKPGGLASCLGGQADIAHQIVDQLRSGEFKAGDGAGRPTFRKVVLAGHSVSGVIAQLTAYSFRNIDGLIVVASGDRGPSPLAQRTLAGSLERCDRGGERAEGPGTPRNYAFYAPSPDAFATSVFADAEPAVVAATKALRNRNPCGDLRTFAPGIQTDLKNVGSITVRVLVILGREDLLFPPPTGRRQVALLTGSKDVSLREISGVGHAITLERKASRFRSAVEDWLEARDFTGATG